jgi:hypothetical protein
MDMIETAKIVSFVYIWYKILKMYDHTVSYN